MTSSAPHIIVVGSINMDLLIRCARLPAPGETILAQSSTQIPGGKGANQAVAAARAGAEVTMIGRVGDDAFAGKLLDNLNRENVLTKHIRTSKDCASGTAIVAVETSGENSIMVIPGANETISPQEIAGAAEIIGAADALLVQLEIPIQSVSTAVDIARAAGVRVILDPAPISAPLPDLPLEVDLICPNHTEAAVLTGRTIQSVQDARRCIPILHRQGASNAVITMGNQGAVISDSHHITWLEPAEVSAVDSTAAGDAFAAALAVRLAEGATLQEAAQFANVAGALATTRWGAQPSLPRRVEIDHFSI
ncbi:MAG: ribokinase [Pirellulales bacterium]|nr:ribokinase [Pirellulales bacterium]